MHVVAKAVIAGAWFFFALSTASAQSVNGVIKVSKGDVQIKSAKNGDTRRARIGEQVVPKDVIITGKDSRAKIVMVDSNEINVSPDSQIEIQNYEFNPEQGKKDVLLNVIYGKVRAKVEQHYDGKTSTFQVKTPAAVAGVRGTDFMTSYDRASGNSQVVTFRGAVEFGLPGPGGSIKNAVSVTPGKVASSAGGIAPAAPQAMPKEQLAKADNESRSEPPPPATTGPSKNGPAPASDKGASNNAPTSDGGARAPASVNSPVSDAASAAPAPSTLKPEDLPAASPPPPPPVVSSVPASVVAQPVVPTTTPQCQVCNQLIQSGNTKVTVQVK